MSTQLRVGAASTVLTPETGLTMGGYAARESPATDVLDDLRCQAVVFADGETTLVLAVCDLLYLNRPLSTAVRTRLGKRLGVPASNVMLAATHTHCGPAGISATSGPLLEHLTERVVTAVVQAHRNAVPARLVAGERAVPGIACNRRDGGAEADDSVRVVAALPATGDGDAIAVVVGFACHPTVLDPGTCAYSADYPGALRATVEATCGGRAVFLQGCAGDVNPSFTAPTPAEAYRVGRIVGSAAAETVLRLARSTQEPRMIDLSLGHQVPVDPAVRGGPVQQGRLAAAERRVPSRVRVRPPHDEVSRERATVGDRGPRAAELWIEDLFVTRPEVFDTVLDRPVGPEESLPVQVFALGSDLSLVALPGEPFTATGRAVRAAGAGTVLVAGYANESVGYLPTLDECDRGGYEVGCAEYAPGTAEALTEAATSLLAELGGEKQ